MISLKKRTQPRNGSIHRASWILWNVRTPRKRASSSGDTLQCSRPMHSESGVRVCFGLVSMYADWRSPLRAPDGWSLHRLVKDRGTYTKYELMHNNVVLFNCYLVTSAYLGRIEG